MNQQACCPFLQLKKKNQGQQQAGIPPHRCRWQLRNKTKDDNKPPNSWLFSTIGKKCKRRQQAFRLVVVFYN